MELNERHRGDPWSIRQTGVYQRYDTMTASSAWIVLQPSDYIRQRLYEALGRESDSVYDITLGPLHLHGLFLSASERNWDDWIEHIQRETEFFVPKNNRNRFT